jgi:hypothetical protein
MISDLDSVGNLSLPLHKARIIKRNKGVVSWYNPRGLEKLFLGSSCGITLGRLDQIESLSHRKRFGCWIELGDNSCNPIGILL